jgi:hypothetical protein
MEEDREIGLSEFVLRGGGLTVDRHRLVEGASLTSNYYTARTKSHVLIVAITNLEANFGGAAQDLTAAQVYFTDADLADITARKGGARWIAVRVLDKTPAQ